MIRTALLGFAFIAGLMSASASDYDRALNMLVSNNLEARVAALKGDAEAAALRAENQLSGPEAEFSRVWGTNVEVGNKWALSVSQGFDWPGIYAARRDAARSAESAAEFLRASAMLDARREARLLLNEYIHNAQLLELQQGFAARIDSLEIHYRKASAQGVETRLDYKKTVLERLAVHRELHQLEREQRAILVRLQAFNGGANPAEVLALVGTSYPEVDKARLSQAVALVEERDPAYAAAKAQAETARRMVKVERMSGLPGFSIGYEHETELGGSFNGFSVGVSLPSWSRKHSRRAAALAAQMAEIDAEVAVLQKKAALEEEFSQLSFYEHNLREYADVVNDTTVYDLLQRAFFAQQINFLTLMQEVNYFMEARRQYIDLQFEYQQAVAKLKYYE